MSDRTADTRKESSGFIIRLGLLAAILTLLSLWSHRHFRIGIGDPGPLVGIVAVMSAVAGLLGKLLQGDETERMKTLLRGAGRAIASTTALVILTVGLIPLLLSLVCPRSSSFRRLQEWQRM